MGIQLDIFGKAVEKKTKQNIVNIASVPQRSPFRYPGGKTWLIPVVRKWLSQESQIEHLIEPFAGGGIVGLTAAFENFAKKITMVELDEEVSTVWQVILSENNDWLATKIQTFNLTHENINGEFSKLNKKTEDVAFNTILKNRIYHGGILAKGSGLIKNGENGKGIASRWYPQTLAKRIRAINYVKHKIDFYQADAFEIIEKYNDDKNCYFFIDPPYTIAGKRLYKYHEIDHEKLFYYFSRFRGKFMLTYDNTDEIINLAKKYNLLYKKIPMKTTHHITKYEIIISDNFNWWEK